MKRIYLANILILLTAFTSVVTAEDSVSADMADVDMTSTAAPTTPSMTTSGTDMVLDPTLAFFSAMSTCAAGNYTEKNIIATEVGPAMLDHTIIGLNSDQTMCDVILSTPDGRKLSCAFPVNSLDIFNEQHFLQGMLGATTDSPSKDSVNADMTWSQMKEDYCNFDDAQ